jgi:hypothetical protein
MRRLFRGMEHELGPLIWPSDHAHGILPPGVIYQKDCPACRALYRHSAGCACGHCPGWAA